MLKRAGLLTEILERGILLQTFSWRRLNGEAIATLRFSGENAGLVALPVPELTRFLLDKLGEQSTAFVHFGHRVTNVGTTGEQGWVDVEVGSTSAQKLFADYILGCDGGKSAVRKSLFGHNFPGFTWEEQVIATDVCVSKCTLFHISPLIECLGTVGLRYREVRLDRCKLDY